ncbi:MAG: putative baseplate assembly protein [Terracidiphilus sp.]
MSCAGTSGCTCGCCAGVAVETPQGESNLPGLSAIAYRTGTWATFKQSMLARLSSSDYPALAQLKTRDNDDFSIALLDAAAVVLDILTFYQERLANESYLRTATQLRSLVELSRLIGYTPAPGVAALTYLAFTLKAVLGQPPNPSTPAIFIPQGTQVQSVPVQGQTAQTFETSADIPAKPDWNALPVLAANLWKAPGHASLYLAGTATQLNPGDALLIMGIDREEASPGALPNEQWDVAILNKVTADTQNNITRVEWDKRLTHATSGSNPTWSTAKVFAFRQKAALFGNNAPNPYLFTLASNTLKTSLPNLINDCLPTWQWYNYQIPSSSSIYLDATYSKIAVNSWFALFNGEQVQLYKVTSAITQSPAEYALSGKVTTLAADYDDSSIGSTFPLQGTAVMAQSDQLTVAQQPLDYPLYGSVIDLEDLRPDLAAVQAVAITGTAQKLTVKTGAGTLTFDPDDQTQSLNLGPGDVVTIIDPSPLPLKGVSAASDWRHNSTSLPLRVADASGRTGTLNAALDNFTLADAAKTDAVVQEVALVTTGFSADPYPHTQLFLSVPLQNCYNREVTTVNANVGLASAGASVSEIMGSGSAATPDQSFKLKQTPLTYVQAVTPTGRQSTLQVLANGVAWTEVPTLYEQGPSQQVFSVLNQPGGATTVLFGDGQEGATLPTGQNNIQANYRVGSGSAGNVAAGAITTLMDRPLGVSGVINPQTATGGQDPQSLSDIQANAPLSVLTLGRAVSITDYQNFAASYAGIVKANAIWIPSGPGRGVFLTVAAVDGAELKQDNPTLTQLVASLQAYGNPLIPIHAFSFLETLFSIKADLTYEPGANATAMNAVNTTVTAALQENYSFANRSFGQGVTADEVAAFIQAVPGVVAVNVKHIKAGLTSKTGDITGSNWSLLANQNWQSQLVTLTRPWAGPKRICPYLPVANPDTLPQPAEILVLDPDPSAVKLGVMR